MRTFLAILLAAALIGCDETPQPKQQETETEKRNNSRLAVAAVGAESIRNEMNDPESFKLTSAHIVEETTRERPMRTIDPHGVTYDGPDSTSQEDAG